MGIFHTWTLAPAANDCDPPATPAQLSREQRRLRRLWARTITDALRAEGHTIESLACALGEAPSTAYRRLTGASPLGEQLLSLTPDDRRAALLALLSLTPEAIASAA